jgi:microcompartment protein CcmK/EutM
MFLGKVIGSVVSTIKDPGMKGLKLLIVVPCNEKGKAIGTPIVSADIIKTSGIGDFVYLVSRREASMAIPGDLVPVDSGIAGFVDSCIVKKVKKNETR